MAVAFYIPDQATLLRKASEQEQQILRMREHHWKFIASVVLDALQQYVGSTPNYMLGRRRGGKSGKAKLRKPTN